jgi:hypothetical protein
MKMRQSTKNTLSIALLLLMPVTIGAINFWLGVALVASWTIIVLVAEGAKRRAMDEVRSRATKEGRLQLGKIK